MLAWFTNEGSDIKCDTESRVSNVSLSSKDTPLKTFECDYDVNPTFLFMNIHSKNYDQIFPTLLPKDTESKEWQQYCVEALTWVTRRENGKCVWRILPIHAAVAGDAPIYLIAALISLSKTSLTCQTDHNQLPLHMSYRRNEKAIIDLIFHNYPEGAHCKDYKGRVPSVLDPKPFHNNLEYALSKDVRGGGETTRTVSWKDIPHNPTRYITGKLDSSIQVEECALCFL